MRMQYVMARGCGGTIFMYLVEKGRHSLASTKCIVFGYSLLHSLLFRVSQALWASVGIRRNVPEDRSANLRPCGKRYTNNPGVYTWDKCILHVKAQIINLLEELQEVIHVNKPAHFQEWYKRLEIHSFEVETF